MKQLSPAELAGYLDWFRTLPAWLDLGDLRAVHACWDDEQLAVFADGRREYGPFTAAFLRTASDRGTPLYHAVDVTMKGKEGKLPTGVSFRDKYGHERTEIRTRWYAAADGRTYEGYALQSDPIVCTELLSPEVVAAARPYPAGAPPVFVGHYWLSAPQPTLLAPNVACLDYSVANGGFLCAYRWDGERVLDPTKFFTAQAGTAR